MQIIRNDKQKENLGKLCWDMGKVVFTVLVITPLAKPQAIGNPTFTLGILVGTVLWLSGYVIDGMEARNE